MKVIKTSEILLICYVERRSPSLRYAINTCRTRARNCFPLFSSLEIYCYRSSRQRWTLLLAHKERYDPARGAHAAEPRKTGEGGKDGQEQLLQGVRQLDSEIRERHHVLGDEEQHELSAGYGTGRPEKERRTSFQVGQQKVNLYAVLFN